MIKSHLSTHHFLIIICTLLVSFSVYAEHLAISIDNKSDREVNFHLPYKDTHGNVRQKNLTLRHNKLRVLFFTAIDPISVEYPTRISFAFGESPSAFNECQNKFIYNPHFPCMLTIINPDGTCVIN